jgi:SAM-dependent methyltransferase
MNKIKILLTEVLIFDILKLYGYVAKLSLKSSKKRTKEQVKSEYEDGLWDKKYDSSLYTQRGSGYGKRADDKIIFVNDGKISKGYWKDIVQMFEKQLTDILSNYRDEETVELGCGIGYNLFKLKKIGFKKLHGYEISKNAIGLAKIHNKKIQSDINFDVLDITEKLPNFTGKIIFTVGCLEQLKHSMNKVVQNIIDSNPKLVINFEVDYDNASFLTRKYFDVADFQNNLVQEINKNKNIEIISIDKLDVDISPLNTISAIIWKPIT